jgi:hypothetical protein
LIRDSLRRLADHLSNPATFQREKNNRPVSGNTQEKELQIGSPALLAKHCSKQHWFARLCGFGDRKDAAVQSPVFATGQQTAA